MHVHKRSLNLICASVVAFVAIGVTSAPAAAHAIVQRTEPRIDEVVADAPGRVVMSFSEPVEIAFGAIRVFDTNRDRVDAGEAEHLPDRADTVQVPLEDDLAGGTYTVTWRVVSADGHPIEEAFVFHVGAPGPNPEGIASEILGGEGGAGPLEGALFGAARWLNFAGLLALAGACVFFVAVWRPTSRDRSIEVHERFLGRWKKLLVWAWVTVVVATIASFALQGAVAGDLSMGEAFSPSVLAEVADTRFGRVSIVKAILLVLAAVVGVAASRRMQAGRSAGAAAAVPMFPMWGRYSGFGLMGLLLVTPGLAGHAGSTSPVLVNVIADALHLLGGAAWVGGLLALLVAAFPAIRGPTEDRVRGLAPVVTRFSDMAVIGVGVIVVTGSYATWIEVGALRAFTGATYGIVLLSKIGVFIPILVLGAINNRVMKPRIKSAGKAEARASLTTFKRLVTAEVALAAIVLALTAFLVNLPPAKVAAGVSGPFVADVRLDDANLNIVVDPNQVGKNEVHLTATEASGGALAAKEMRVLFRMPEEDIGPIPADGRRLAPGHFIVDGNQLSVAGTWELEVVVRVSRFDEKRTTVTVEVNG